MTSSAPPRLGRRQRNWVAFSCTRLLQHTPLSVPTAPSLVINAFWRNVVCGGDHAGTGLRVEDCLGSNSPQWRYQPAQGPARWRSPGGTDGFIERSRADMSAGRTARTKSSRAGRSDVPAFRARGPAVHVTWLLSRPLIHYHRRTALQSGQTRIPMVASAMILSISCSGVLPIRCAAVGAAARNIPELIDYFMEQTDLFSFGRELPLRGVRSARTANVGTASQCRPGNGAKSFATKKSSA